MISHDDLVTMARKACEGSLRPTYCKDLANFYPHLWVIEAMKMAYERGAAEVQRRDVEALVEHVDDIAKAVTETVTLQARAVTQAITLKMREMRVDAMDVAKESCDLRDAEFVVINGKVVKDRWDKGAWPPITPAHVTAVGFKDLRNGSTVYGTSPAGWYGSGRIGDIRHCHRGIEYHVTFGGGGGADWYSAHHLDSSPRLPSANKECTSRADVCECPPEAVGGTP